MYLPVPRYYGSKTLTPCQIYRVRTLKICPGGSIFHRKTFSVPLGSFVAGAKLTEECSHYCRGPLIVSYQVYISRSQQMKANGLEVQTHTYDMCGSFIGRLALRFLLGLAKPFMEIPLSPRLFPTVNYLLPHHLEESDLHRGLAASSSCLPLFVPCTPHPQNTSLACLILTQGPLIREPELTQIALSSASK